MAAVVSMGAGRTLFKPLDAAGVSKAGSNVNAHPSEWWLASNVTAVLLVKLLSDCFRSPFDKSNVLKAVAVKAVSIPDGGPRQWLHGSAGRRGHADFSKFSTLHRAAGRGFSRDPRWARSTGSLPGGSHLPLLSHGGWGHGHL